VERESGYGEHDSDGAVTIATGEWKEGESIVPPMIHQRANEPVIANSKFDWEIPDSA
jgi:hypothetical protein